MFRVYLADNILTGHHEVYLNTILSMDNVQDVSESIEFENNKKSMAYYLGRINFVKKMLRKVQEDKYSHKKIVHFLYLDNLYIIPKIFSFAKRENISILGTLHHMPQNKMKMALLKICAKQLQKIIVHSEFIKEELLKNGIENVQVIDYPTFYDYSNYLSKRELRIKHGISDEKIVLSALGGTRYDKGLDILLESFNLINIELKNKILLNIMGREESFTESYIQECIKESRIDNRVKLGFLGDDEFAENILLSDFIVLPYRKIFTGNSGPMTEAVVNGIPVIGPRQGNLGYLIEKYKLGNTFEVENTLDLARCIENTVCSGIDIGNDYKHRLNLRAFLKKHCDVYKEL